MPGVAFEKRHLTFHQHAEKPLRTAFVRDSDDLSWTGLPPLQLRLAYRFLIAAIQVKHSAVDLAFIVLGEIQLRVDDL